MADDDLYDDDSSGFDPFSRMDSADEKPSRRSDKGGSSDGKRTLADFRTEVSPPDLVHAR
ncbi:MAG: hypothetical protein IPK52_22420 [Chloroflexi bacterium]|nr:hypothetical protein [Chloroflexota bacterium]